MGLEATILTYLLAYIFGIFSAWAKWRFVDRGRNQDDRRREKIDRLRQDIEIFDWYNRSFSDFSNTDSYLALRDDLNSVSPDAIDSLERTFIAPRDDAQLPQKHRLLEAVAQLEREWGLA